MSNRSVITDYSVSIRPWSSFPVASTFPKLSHAYLFVRGRHAASTWSSRVHLTPDDADADAGLVEEERQITQKPQWLLIRITKLQPIV